jgi:hypothetical protein
MTLSEVAEQTKLHLIALAAVPDYASYITTAVKVEQGINTLRLNGDLMGAAVLKGQWLEIARAILPGLKAKAFTPAREYSWEELQAYQQATSEERAALADTPVNLREALNQFRKEAASVPLSLETTTAFICALVASSTSLDAVGERETMQAAE